MVMGPHCVPRPLLGTWLAVARGMWAVAPRGRCVHYLPFMEDSMVLLNGRVRFQTLAVIPEKAPVGHFPEHFHTFFLLLLFFSFLWLAVIL